MAPRVILLDFFRRRAEVVEDPAAQEAVLKSSILPREVRTTVSPEPPRTNEQWRHTQRRPRAKEDR
jgi:hypothetical protein